MGAPQKADGREERRTRAWERKQQGWKHTDMAGALGVTEGAISQWMKSGRAGGKEALTAHPAKGASASGCGGEVWNSRRLAVAFKRECGVSAHPDHGGSLVRTLGDSMQKPVARASQRNEEAIKRWKAQQWPQRQKKAEQEKRARIFVDEAGFSLLPMIVRTSALRGQTPVLRVTLTRDHLSAIGGITPQGRLFMQMQARASNAEDVVRFVRLL